MSYLDTQENSMVQSLQHNPRIYNSALRPRHFRHNVCDPCQILQHFQHRRRLAYKPKTLPNIPTPHNLPHNISYRHFQPRRALLRQCFSKESRYYDLQDAVRLTRFPGHWIGDWCGRFQRHSGGRVGAGSFRLVV